MPCAGPTTGAVSSRQPVNTEPGPVVHKPPAARLKSHTVRLFNDSVSWSFLEEHLSHPGAESHPGLLFLKILDS